MLQNAASSCRYTVTIKTSCNSPKYTRDRISLSFGDAYGYQVGHLPKISYLSQFEINQVKNNYLLLINVFIQVYVPRLDDPSSRTFERCSTDTFDVYGPCTYQICYLYLYRTGYDGWKPESVTVYTYNYPAASFYYNAFIPSGIWYGFDFCRGYLPSSASA